MFKRGITIAVSGKGGVGKTNTSALLIRFLSNKGAVLAIDADPDTNLPSALGVKPTRDLGQAREAVLGAPERSRIASSRGEALKVALAEVVEELPEFDLLVMGRPEGSGCYCGVNSIVRGMIDARAISYDFVVIDCEPGLEHLSRRTTLDVDIMLVVTDATVNGVLTAKRIQELAKELNTDFGTVMLVANKVTEETKPIVDKIAQENGLEVAAYIPYDPLLAQFDISGTPVTQLPSDSVSSLAIDGLYRKITEYC